MKRLPHGEWSRPKIVTLKTFITSSPGRLITLTAMRSELGLSKNRLSNIDENSGLIGRRRDTGHSCGERGGLLAVSSLIRFAKERVEQSPSTRQSGIVQH